MPSPLFDSGPGLERRPELNWKSADFTQNQTLPPFFALSCGMLNLLLTRLSNHPPEFYENNRLPLQSDLAATGPATAPALESYASLLSRFPYAPIRSIDLADRTRAFKQPYFGKCRKRYHQRPAGLFVDRHHRWPKPI